MFGTASLHKVNFILLAWHLFSSNLKENPKFVAGTRERDEPRQDRKGQNEAIGVAEWH